jgi:hypothetical protein
VQRSGLLVRRGIPLACATLAWNVVGIAFAQGRRAHDSRRGFRVRRLTDGFPEWKRAGLPVAAGGGG